MLPKYKRFTKEDFLRTRPKVFFRGDILDVAYTVLPTQKFACIISKKTLKTAVARNSVKRKVMNVINALEVQSQNSFIIYPKKSSKDIPYALLKEEIKKAFATLQ